jgi:hypothetical protein
LRTLRPRPRASTPPPRASPRSTPSRSPPWPSSSPGLLPRTLPATEARPAARGPAAPACAPRTSSLRAPRAFIGTAGAHCRVTARASASALNRRPPRTGEVHVSGAPHGTAQEQESGATAGRDANIPATDSASLTVASDAASRSCLNRLSRFCLHSSGTNSGIAMPARANRGRDEGGRAQAHERARKSSEGGPVPARRSTRLARGAGATVHVPTEPSRIEKHTMGSRAQARARYPAPLIEGGKSRARVRPDVPPRRLLRRLAARLARTPVRSPDGSDREDVYFQSLKCSADAANIFVFSHTRHVCGTEVQL